MSTSNKSVSKEVRSCCKCIVKEKPCKKVRKPAPEKPCVPAADERQNNTSCKATITGEIVLPTGCCMGCGRGDNGTTQREPENREQSNHYQEPVVSNESGNNCGQVYQQLGQCLQSCIVDQYLKNKSNNNAFSPSNNNAYGPSNNNAYGPSNNNVYGPSNNNAYSPSNNNAYGPSTNNAYGQSNNNAYGQSNNNAYGQSNNNAYGQSNNNAFRR